MKYSVSRISTVFFVIVYRRKQLSDKNEVIESGKACPILTVIISDYKLTLICAY